VNLLRRLLFLNDLRPAADFALLGMRLVVGAFLIWGLWDNIESPARMAEFAGFLQSHGFAQPQLLAPLSVWAQFLCGATFILGLFTRWAGLVCAFNFVVALVMVDAAGGVRAAFPSTMLILLGLYLAANGGGRFALDSVFTRRAAPA
jgi:putative oxidoreductase